ncbi:hypothetical protein EPUS_02846 [Endocarpon pusillum Z07020]|uniref:AMP-activated protein kinase glycogen-binding domain-containing protein n=1 Tax=Endocarpon pusillum (strain Z07020 / HMAS-L-300199) TaxID=1263415 RepID=U1HTH5_ENDPU|nr:uncharacterized protein EPUS_02846 [Endocarpon pusillum Z07020]ERF72564.1 hypothetical protein EPUS_02846 [Endocarpon pusillum Z07020]
MSGPAVQLSFTLRTSPNVKTVHLVGSWDGYKNQLPLSVVREAKPGSWKGTFRFQGSHALKLGSRYWYYYIVDGYHVSHDPAKDYTTEPTTGRKLNVLDVPDGKSAPSTPYGTKAPASNRYSREIPKGRALSPGKIQHPRPSKPYASRQLREADYSTSPVATDDLADRFAGTKISDNGYSYPSSPASTLSSSSGATFSDSGSGGSSPSSFSSVSSTCTCERYGITRSGQKVKLDCGGSRCGYTSGSASDCSSETSSESEEEYAKRKSRSYGARRQSAYYSSSRR